MEPADADHPKDLVPHFQVHSSASSVVMPHGFNYMFIQACVAILILVGFESVTSMGEEAKNAKRDIPRAVLLSLLIQGVVCYLIQYFAAGYFLNPGYTMTKAAGASAPIGDMMVIVGTWLFGSAEAGWWFMFIQAITVFLALIGTTLSCICTGARVTYAMGRDDEVPSHFGMLHGKNLTPHRAIWTLAAVSTVIGIFAVLMYLCGPAATDALNTGLTPEQKDSIWYPSALLFSMETAKDLPNSLLIVTLVSNFGTFMLYMLTCCVAIVAFREHHTFNTLKHVLVPVFGVLANLVCMLFYIVGPFAVSGMSKLEPFIALGVAGVWGAYGLAYFALASKKKGRTILVDKQYVAERMPAAAS
jgi:basic amino acid/polyamine antiporter, APA family